MTVKLLAKWGDQPPGTLYTAATAGTETAMIAAGQATANLAGAIVWVPPGSSPGIGIPVYRNPVTGSLVLGDGTVFKIPRLIAEKSAITDGAIQTADQVIGALPIPAGSLNVGDVFRVLVSLGRDNNTDAFGTAQSLRLGTTGTVADSLAGQINLSSIFPAASGGLSAGNEAWWRVVSIGANSVIENLGVANGGTSWSAASASGAAVGTQRTLTGYDLTTQAGFFTITTTMTAATATKPRTGHMRLEVQT